MAAMYTDEQRGKAWQALYQRFNELPVPQENVWMVQADLTAALERVGELSAILNTPETGDFFVGVPLEAAHQRQRWGPDHDGGKEPSDWFWLVGYLAGKCLAAHLAGNTEKALHHTISAAAALANWHRAIKGKGNMRPGIEVPGEAS